MALVVGGVVDQHRGVAERGVDPRHRGAQGVDVQEVARHEQRRCTALAGHLPHQRFAGIGIDVEKSDPGLLCRERTHECGANAGGAAGDQHDTAREAGIEDLGHAISRSVTGVEQANAAGVEREGGKLAPARVGYPA